MNLTWSTTSVRMTVFFVLVAFVPRWCFSSSSLLLVVLMLTCYAIKSHIAEEPDNTLILPGNEKRSWWGTYTDTFRPWVTLWPS